MTEATVSPAAGGAFPDVGVSPVVPFVRDLGLHGDRLALLAGDGALTYQQLAARVSELADELGPARRLVLVAMTNHIDDVVAYLAALAAGNVVLLAPPAHAESVAAGYDPDVTVTSGDGGQRIDIRREISAHELHPELAMLMSTSGSTGSPKLVRLSHENLQANAESIASYLGIRDSDRAATTLPLHYCYGLSVLHSHLLRGAGVILTDLSVADACFWDLFRSRGGTSFAGVPHTFDLLDRVGFAELRLPRLRYVTQAGGRLAPEKVRRYAELGQRRGWDFFVMYGQTEATARMAYLPPDLAASNPGAVGVPVPGGSFSLQPSRGDDEVGELVYSGPNVMLGYAEAPADLALGRVVTQLRTGDLARRTPEGLWEIVGRESRFAKIAGLRVDLDRLESALAEQGVTACVAGRDDELAVAVEGAVDAAELRARLAAEHGLPAHAIAVYSVAELPRLQNGKPDYQAVLEQQGRLDPAADPAPATGASPADLRDLYAWLLNRPDATLDSTFVSLGGDSLSYVEMSVRLEQSLGRVPPNWHVTPVRDLAQAPRKGWFGGRRVETSVLLRAVAIVCVVGTHAGWFTLLGGAHVLLAVAGFNYARFRLTDAGRLRRLRQQLSSLARIVAPSVVWIAAAAALSGQYSFVNVVLLNGFLGPPTWTEQWHFWFVEVLVWILVATAGLMALPWADRLERRFPFGFALGLLGVGLLGRFEVVDIGVPHTLPAFWLFALGWAAARATTFWRRAAVTAAVVVAVPGFFDNSWREAAVIAGVALLVWTASVACPAPLSRLAGVLASASLYIYLTHWQVYPRLVDIHPAAATVVSLVAGAALWAAVTKATAFSRDRRRLLSRRS